MSESAGIELRPGVTPLADWRDIYRGAPLTLDPIARADVEAGRAALAEIAAGSGKTPAAEAGAGSPSVAELLDRSGEALPASLLRLFTALKLSSLAQGASGIRWNAIEALAEFLQNDLLPVISVESASDRLALARLFSALTGSGEALRAGRVRPAQKALKKVDLKPLKLNARERFAFLSGTQLSIAAALAGLFEAERVFQTALVAAALSRAGYPGTALHKSVRRLHRQRGQADVATAFRSLLEGSVPDEQSSAPLENAAARPLAECAFRLGACLDLLRNAGAMLERAANSVSEDQLVLWQSGEIVSGSGNLSSVALASHLIALSLQAIGDLSEERFVPGNATPHANENASSLQARAAAFVAENRERAGSMSFDPAGVWRLMPMAGTATLVIAIEILEATRATAPSRSLPGRLSTVVASVRRVADPENETGAATATNLAAVGALIGSGTLLAGSGLELPSVTPGRRNGSLPR